MSGNILKEFPAHNRKIYKIENENMACFKVCFGDLPKYKIKKIKSFVKQLERKIEYKKYILPVIRHRIMQCPGNNGRNGYCGLAVECRFYTIPERFGEFNFESIEVFMMDIFELFESFQRDQLEFIMMIARNLRLVVVDGKVECVICPFTEEFSICDNFTHCNLMSDRYFRLIPGCREHCEYGINVNKVAVFVLGLKIYEIVIRKELEHYDTIDSILSFLGQYSEEWIPSILLKMLEINDDARADFTQLLNLTKCSICHNFKQTTTPICSNCTCSQCGLNEKFQSSFCNKNLCITCLNSGNFCSDCSHFTLLHQDSLENPQKIPIGCCLCGKDWVLASNIIHCDCGDYCATCKNLTHDPPCFQIPPQTLKIMCEHCRTPAQRCFNTFYYRCQTCQSDLYCLVCYKQVSSVSHSKCVKLLSGSVNN